MNVLASNRKDQNGEHCPRLVDHVTHLKRLGISILHKRDVTDSYMVDVWAILIVSKVWINVRNIVFIKLVHSILASNQFLLVSYFSFY